MLPDYLLALDNTLKNPWPEGWPEETNEVAFVRVSTLRSPRPGIPRRGPPRVENLKYLTCAQPTLLPDYFIALDNTLEHPKPETIPWELAPNPIYHSYEAVEPPPLPQLIKIHAFPLWGCVFPRTDMLEWLTPGIPSKHIIRSGGLKVLDRPHLRSVKSIFWILSLPAPLATPAWPWSLTACRKKQKRHPRLLPDYLLALDNTLENPWPEGWPEETNEVAFVRVSTLRSPRPGIPRRGATQGRKSQIFHIDPAHIAPGLFHSPRLYLGAPRTGNNSLCTCTQPDISLIRGRGAPSPSPANQNTRFSTVGVCFSEN